MGNPFIDALEAQKAPQASTGNPFIDAAPAAPAESPAVAKLRAATQKYPKAEEPGFLSDERSPKLNQFISDISRAPEILEPENDPRMNADTDSKAMRFVKGAARAGTGLVSLPAQVAGAVQEEVRTNPFIQQGLATDPQRAIGQLVLNVGDKLLFQPQKQLYDEANQVAADTTQSEPDRIAAANTLRTLAFLPVLGPIISENANQRLRGDSAGANADLLANAAMLGMGGQGKKMAAASAAEKAAIAAEHASVLNDVATLESQRSGVAPEVVKQKLVEGGASLKDLQDTKAAIQADLAQKAEAAKAAAAQQAEAAKQVPSTTAELTGEAPKVNAEVPVEMAGQPALPAKDLKAAEKVAAKVNPDHVITGGTAEGDAIPIQALAADPHGALERAGLVVDSRGRFFKIERPANPEAGQAALEPEAQGTTPVPLPESELTKQKLLSAGQPSVAAQGAEASLEAARKAGAKNATLESSAADADKQLTGMQSNLDFIEQTNPGYTAKYLADKPDIREALEQLARRRVASKEGAPDVSVTPGPAEAVQPVEPGRPEGIPGSSKTIGGEAGNRAPSAPVSRVELLQRIDGAGTRIALLTKDLLSETDPAKKLEIRDAIERERSLRNDSYKQIDELDANEGRGKQRGAVRSDLLFSPLEGANKVAEKVGEAASEGRGVAAAVASEQKKPERLSFRGGEPPTPPPSGAAVPPSGETPKYSGSINLERTPEAVRQEYLDRYKADQANIDANIRKTGKPLAVTEKNARAIAEEMGMDEGKFRSMVKKGTVNDEQINALRFARDTEQKAFAEAKAKYQETGAIQDKLAAQAALERYAAAYNATQRQAAQAGRTLNSLKILSEAQDIAKNNAEKAAKFIRQNLGDDWEAKSQEILDRMSEIDPNDHAAFNRMIRDYHKFSTKDKVRSYWIANVLSGVGTQVKNFVDNNIHMGAEVVSRAAAGAVDAVKSAVTGKPRQVYANEAIASLNGRLNSFPEAMKAVKLIMSEGAEAAHAVGVKQPRYYELPGGAKNPLNIAPRLLSASDAMNETLAISGEMKALALRKAQQEGATGKALTARVQQLLTEKPEWLTDAAVKQARHELYKDELGPVAKNLLKARDADPTGILGFMFPFVEIPVNYAKANFGYSPLGFLKLATKEGRTGPVGSINTARAAIGSAAAAYFAYKAANGELTGAVPKDAGEKDAFFRQGKRPWSINVGGKWVNIGFLGPFGLTAGAVASAHDAYQKNQKFDTAEIVKQATVGVLQGMNQQTFLQGVNNLSNALNGDLTAVQNAASSMLQGFIPLSGFWRSVTAVTDTKDRKPENVFEQIEANLPGLSKNVPSRLNALGEESDSSRLRFMQVYDRNVKNPDIEKELARMEVTPKPPDTTLRLGSHQYDLSRDQQRELTVMLGDARKQALRQLFSNQVPVTVGKGETRASGTYNTFTDEQKQAAIKNVLDDAYQAARDEFVNRINSRNEAVKEKPKRAKLQFVGAE